jgi:hypothetical protein
VKLTESEEDFARWMEEVDLEEVNLLPNKPRPSLPDASAFDSARGAYDGKGPAQPSNALRGEGKPALGPARDTGWKAD